jgi:two-component system cell cycle sensor histidine kinase PleC
MDASDVLDSGRYSGALDKFIVAVAPMPPETPCADAYTRFVDSEELFSIPVCNAGVPVGLIDRYSFLSQLAHSYGRALFAKKPVETLMDRNPMVVDRRASVDQIQRTISTERNNALIRGFVVTDDGLYFGMGTALSLMRASQTEAETMNAKLRDALAQAERAVQLKSTFLANMSHEFRTPLNAIIGFSEIIVAEIAGPIDPRYKEYAGDILTSGRHMLALINDLLDFAKIEAGEMQTSPEEIDVAETIGAVMRMFRSSAEHARVELAVSVADDIRPAYADPRQIRQILINLVSNAVKFTQAGSIRVSASKAGSEIEIAIADTGIGMTAAEIDVAMRPFGQIANHLTRQHDGTGLGLPLVKALAELNRTSFELASSPGVGTRVTLHLPTRPT